jgi:co-chaperonin GroES (HSP10)
MVIKQLTDDHILLEALEPDEKVNGIYRPTRISDEKVLARVIAVGPGDLNPAGTRNPMPCKVGDTVLVGQGAGFHYKDYWFVYGGRKDVIAVVETSPALVAA